VTIEVAEINIAASGPKTTAANKVGRSPMDTSVLELMATVRRSAAAAAKASTRTTHTLVNV
jgi:hypothetical protein